MIQEKIIMRLITSFFTMLQFSVTLILDVVTYKNYDGAPVTYKISKKKNYFPSKGLSLLVSIIG